MVFRPAMLVRLIADISSREGALREFVGIDDAHLTVAREPVTGVPSPAPQIRSLCATLTALRFDNNSAQSG